MPRTPDEYAVHFLISGGHREEVRFATVQEFQNWFSGVLMPKSASNDLITVPSKNTQNEYFMIRPASIMGIRVEPLFGGSVDRDL